MSDTTESVHKCAHTWLTHHLDSRTPEEIAFIVEQLSSVLDHDMLETLFIDEMTMDGYFEEED